MRGGAAGERLSDDESRKRSGTSTRGRQEMSSSGLIFRACRWAASSPSPHQLVSVSSRGEIDTALAALPLITSDAIWSRLSPHPAPNHSVTAREQRIPNLFSSRTHTPSLTPSTSFGESSEHGGGDQPSRRRGKARGKWNGKAASTPALGPSVGPHALVSAWGGATGGCGAWARAMGAFA